MKISVALIVLLALCVRETTSACPVLDNTGGVFTANISWTYDIWEETCTLQVTGSSGKTTTLDMNHGETSPLPGTGGECLKVVCESDVHIYEEDSACAYDGSCPQASEVQYSETCGEPYRCVMGVQTSIPEPTYSGFFNKYKSGWFVFFAGYTCGTTGRGPCGKKQCYNPYADPAKVSTCLDKDSEYVDLLTFHKYRCQQYKTCDPKTFVDLTYVETGCDHNGSYVAPGEVTWSDACRHTVCVANKKGKKGKLVTSFKDYEGCVHEDVCVRVGDTISMNVDHPCQDLTCRKVSDSDVFDFKSDETGCYLNGACHAPETLVNVDGDCKHLLCKINSKGKHVWVTKYTGCYDPYNTTKCNYEHGDDFIIDGCIRNKCVMFNNAQWVTSYISTGSCAPGKASCGGKRKRGSCVPDKTTCGGGCRYNGECYPLNSVIRVDDCTQYVCSDLEDKKDEGEEGVNEDNTISGPRWMPRATGCYGPVGCMKFGQQYRDTRTLNTYRCTYELGGLGIKYAEFHEACVAPNGTTLALGQSVLLGDLWYSCYRFGEMKTPINRFEKPSTEKTCGKNPDTGEWLYTKVSYYTPVAKCKKAGIYCNETCSFYDQPCMETDQTDWRYIGYNLTLDDSECLCTQDYNVNNRPIPDTGSLFHTPFLCSEKGVRNAACRDPDDSSVLRQWGEFWERPEGKKLLVCACHPLKRKAFCSGKLEKVVDALTDMQI